MSTDSSIVEQLATTREQLTQPGAPFELYAEKINGIEYQLYRSAPPTMREAMAVGRQHGDAPFLQYEGESWTFSEFFAEVDAVAYQLQNQYQLGKGDRVAIAMRNYPEWMIAYTAIISLGTVVVPLNSWGQRDDLLYGLQDCGAKLVFCDQQRFDYIADDLDTLGIEAIVARPTAAVNHAKAADYASVRDAVSAEQAASWLDNAFDLDPADPAMILYTSGTTGRPKGALSLHRNMTHTIVNFEFGATQSAMMNGPVIEKMLTCGFPSKSLLAVPLFHVSGLHAQFLLSLRGGRSILMMYKWDPAKALELIANERVTTFSAAPSMVLDLLDHPDFDSTDTQSLMVASGGGAASPPRMKQLVQEKIETPYPGSGYGMTETNASCSSATGVAYMHKPNSSGVVAPIVEIKTCDESGNELAPGETGEIWIRGICVTEGYWNKPEATTESFIDGWFVTGDIGYYDEDGFVFIVDRAKDIIIRGGENISAGEVEGCYLDHPAIREAAAFAVPHDTLGEELGLAVYFKEGQSATIEELKQFGSERLAHFKVPAHYWVRDELLPRNAANKVLKKQLVEAFQAKS